MATSTQPMHPLAPEHLPRFITAPGETDQMMVNVGIFLVGIILIIGVLYLTLHALPERMAHKRNSVQFQLIGILALLALFTHNNIFWLLALVIAVVEVPDFMTPLNSIARSLEKATWRAPDIGPEPDDSAQNGTGKTDHV
ncbi:hypothetical protein [Meridianimarinicoccus aquatilis]|uniref:Uncharacterized protein n=1 Tax=Meridianimarinicoccus aquatilis TaxID=2552766 RepID=A0A4R6AYS2_9RHOB|nr:hypothetical protein [Fluviibacterium aquatile]QIE41885.1 hypothetical protein G5B39_07895 [Rhodobacteraceae bacterium SC52]TDL89407.1 hypothetical protein E2L05_05915 [Fluviibacterium aquatile]